jgi:hydroxymethylpyrimidine pyrophosphatase-like HAD family hydrolase
MVAIYPARRRLRGVPLAGTGHVILATREPHEREVLDAIRELGLEMHVIFNKGAVMALPSGTNKASGLSAALQTTAERFVDPTSGKLLEVRYNPQTGERAYVDAGERQ